jgi:DHA2 family multidrug resistance protein-like MFS transporter
VDIYGFLVAGSLITMGTLGDRIGRRRLLLCGGAAFGIASLIAAFSTSAEMLIAARALLGVAGATLAPSTLSLIRTMFQDSRQRTIAIGVWVTGFSLGGAVGPLVGGVLLEYFWWGSAFLPNVPVMLLLLVLGPVLLPEYRDPDAGRLDLLSAALSLVGVLAVIFGLKQIAEDGVGPLPLLSIVIGLTAGVVFVRRQSALADPLIDLRLFRVRAFSAALAMYALTIFVLLGSFFFIGQYLQLVEGLSPLRAGLWFLPSMAGSIVGAMLVPIVVRRVRPAIVVSSGLALSAVAFLLLAQAGTDSLALVVIASLIMTVSLSPVITLATDLVVGTAPQERAGAASAISETGAELGGALGIAILGSISTAIYRGEVVDSLPAGVTPEAATAARETLGGAVAAAGQLSDPFGPALLSAAQGAFVQGLQFTALICAVIMAGTAVLAGILLRHVEVHTEPAEEPESEPAAQRPPACAA